MALNISSLSSALLPNSAAQLAALARTNSPVHYTADGASTARRRHWTARRGRLLDRRARRAAAGIAGRRRRRGRRKAPSFEHALLKAMDGVSASQNKSDNLLQQVVADPNSVDAQDVTIAMAEANMSLNLAKTILSRIVTAWKDVINTR